MTDFPFRKAPESFKKKIEERKTEAKKAAKNNITSADFQNIKNKLGLSQRDKEARVKQVLRRLSSKSKRAWSAIGITKEDFRRFGIRI